MSLADKIVSALQAEIEKHGLELLKRYPDDLLVHDRARLEMIAGPGMKFAVCLGDSHSHLVAVGITQNQNELVPALTRLSNSDRFYLISVTSQDRFTLVEKTREQFSKLGSENKPQFSLKHGDFGFAQILKNEEPIASVQCTVLGGNMDRSYCTRYNPMRSLSLTEKYAVILHSEEFTTKTAGTLFWRGVVENAQEVKKVA